MYKLACEGGRVTFFLWDPLTSLSHSPAMWLSQLHPMCHCKILGSMCGPAWRTAERYCLRRLYARIFSCMQMLHTTASLLSVSALACTTRPTATGMGFEMLSSRILLQQLSDV